MLMKKYVYVHIYIYGNIRGSENVCMEIYMYKERDRGIYIYIHTYLCVYTKICTVYLHCKQKYVYIANVYIYICQNVGIQVYLNQHVLMYTSKYIYI